LKRFRPQSTPQACVNPKAVPYAPCKSWRRSISKESEPKDLFRQAQQHLQAGEAESAETVCADALGQYPEDANFLCLSARALLKLERYDESNVRIKRALDIFPEFARAHELRGELLFAKGELVAASEAFQEAIKLDPKRPQTRTKLGQVFMHMGRVEEARALKGEIMEFSQDNKDIARAVEYENQEKFDEAENIYRQILARHPDNVSAMRLWARLGVQQERYAGAVVLLQQAVKVAPDFSLAWADLCEVQYKQDKFDDAIESANRLIKLEPRHTDGHIMLASAAASAGHYQDALEYFDNALEIAPNNVRALCAKGNVYRTIGDQEGAIATYRRSIKANPLFAEGYWNLANLKTFRFDDKEVDDMLELVGDERVPSEGQVQVNNALGLEFEARKNYDRAFEFIDCGNKLRREQEFYDRVENEEKADLTIETFTKQYLEDNAGYGHTDPAPIFIVGLPRSGSTLLEQILSSHSRVEGTHELPDLALTIRSDRKLSGAGGRYPTSVANANPDDFKRLGSEYIERTRRHRSSSPYFTDKNPNNFVHVGFLHLILPNAKIINAKRHPLDSCYGTYKQLFAQGQPFSYDLIELGEHYLQYQRLMDHWHEVLPGKVLDVQYEQVVADLEGQIRRILDYCELEWEDSCMRFNETNRAVKSASSEQVRQPIYSSSVNTWRYYQKHLGTLIEVLEPLLAELPEIDRPTSLGGPGA
jgi:tetratricopeptide (TPR) repeat protein